MFSQIEFYRFLLQVGKDHKTGDFDSQENQISHLHKGYVPTQQIWR
jgi:hypothetical protein